MTMNVLDLVMWAALCAILWFLIDKLFDGEFTNEMGAIGGVLILVVFTIIYTILFAIYPDWNWVDFKDLSLPFKIDW